MNVVSSDSVEYACIDVLVANGGISADGYATRSTGRHYLT
jgi:hypothetical protein